MDLLESSAQRYGDCFTLQLGNQPVVFLSNPQAIQEIFTAQPEQFNIGKASKILKPLLGEQSMLLMDGPTHQRQRRLMIPPFHGERMKSYSKIICDITTQVISEWKTGTPFSVRSSMQEISMRVILRAVFGLNEGQRFEQLKQLLCSVLDFTGSSWRSSLLYFPLLQQDLGAWSPWGHFVRQQQQIDKLLYTEIEGRRNETNHSDVSTPSQTDILSLMMSARDDNGEAMTNAELTDQLMTLLVGGHETVALSLTWALYWIHHLPEVHDKLLHELDSIRDDTDLSTVARSPYLSAVCQETLRIYPATIVASPRVVNSPLQIMGYQFEPNTWLTPCIYLTHQRPELYPEPKKFKPERFLERQFPPFEYFPFGGGNRICIGMAFALFEMKLVLATILSRFELAIANNHSVKPVRRGMTIAPCDGNWLVAIGYSSKSKCFSDALIEHKSS